MSQTPPNPVQPEGEPPRWSNPTWADDAPQPTTSGTPAGSAWPTMPATDQPRYPHQELAQTTPSPYPASAQPTQEEPVGNGPDWVGLLNIIAWPATILLFLTTGKWWLFLILIFVLQPVLSWLRVEQRRRRRQGR